MSLPNLSHISRDSWRTYLLAALFFLFPVALGLSNLVLLALIVLWLATWRQRKHWSIMRSTPIIWWLGGLYLMVLLGLTYTSASPDWYVLHLSKYARLLYAIVLICLIQGDERSQKVALMAFSAAMLIILASTWLNVWFLLPWSESQNLGWGKSHHVFGDYITQNVMMSFFAALALHRGMTAKAPVPRAAWLLITLLAVVSITHLSQGRTGYLLVIASLATYIAYSVRGKRLLVYMTGLLVAVSALLLTSDLVERRLQQAIEDVSDYKVDKTSSIGHRLRNYQTTASLIAGAPVIGHGTGAYHVEICTLLSGPVECQTYNWHPHNQFLFLGADHGLIGMALYLGIIATMYVMAWRSTSPTGRPLLAVLASILFLNSLFNSPLWSSRESQFFMYMLALLVCMVLQSGRPDRESEAGRESLTRPIDQKDR